MDILMTIVMMLLVGVLCFLLGAFAQESSEVFQFRNRTEETTRSIEIKVDIDNLKECAKEAVGVMIDVMKEELEQTEENKEDE